MGKRLHGSINNCAMKTIQNISSELLIKRFDETTSIIFDRYLHKKLNTIWPTVFVGPLTANITTYIIALLYPSS